MVININDEKYKNIVFDYEYNSYSTHQPLLIWAAENTSGDILELGCGYSSTILLNHFTLNSSRKLITVDDNSDWLYKFSDLESENHKFLHTNATINNWSKTIDELSKNTWSFIFVDHASLEEIWRISRPYAVKKFLNCSQYIIVHDADLFPELKSNEYFWHEYIPPVKPIATRNGPSTYLISLKNNLSNFNLTV